MTSRTVALALAAAAAALAVGVFTGSFEGRPGVVDTPVYRTYGERIASGDVPYQDFSVEYPPGALAPFVIPALVTTTQKSYDSAFRAEMIAMLVLAAVLVVLALVALGASTGRIAFSVGALLLGTALLGSFILARFDIFAATVSLAAVCAILFRRRIAGPVLLGLAIATKIYPAVLLPLLIARIWRGEGRAAALRGLTLTVVAALAVYLPFALVAPKGVARSVWDQLGRPLQIESLGSGVLLALHHALGMPLGWASSSGSQNLTGTVAGVAATLTTLAGTAALLSSGCAMRGVTSRVTSASSATRRQPSWRSSASARSSRLSS